MATEAGQPFADEHDGREGPVTSTDEEPNAEPEPPSPNTPDKDDVDTCRICRGDGTADEPLFYPCKCSGSIKYVHQECLMEWLSHSQKKYCELCKTPFRFTKLYHPGMPTRIPTSVFIRRAAIHVLKLLVTWCRAVLVVSVWLVLLPWCMRLVWRSLFWVGDGGWSRELYTDKAGSDYLSPGISPWDLDAVHSAIESAKAANTTVSLPIPGLLMPFSQTLNMSAGEPTVWTLVKRFFFGFPYPLSEPSSGPTTNNTNLNTTVDTIGTRNPSLLSDIPFFQWFPSQAANRFLIDVLEGQIITLLVVVAFILIFLIREWVVQQQPVINMVAIGEGDGAAVIRDPDQEEEVLDGGIVDGEDAADEDEQIDDNNADDTPHELEETEQLETLIGPTGPQQSSSELRRRANMYKMLQESDEIPEELKRAMQAGTAEDLVSLVERMPIEESLKLKEQLIKFSQRLRDDPPDDPSEATQNHEDTTDLRATQHGTPSSNASLNEPSSSVATNSGQPLEESGNVSPSSRQRPDMPSRERSSIATEIRRSLEEGNSWSFANTTKDVEETQKPSDDGNVPESWEDEEPRLAETGKLDERASSEQDQGSEDSNESWQQIPEMEDETRDQSDEFMSKVKGKAKVTDDSLGYSPDNTLAPPQDGDEVAPMHTSSGQSGAFTPTAAVDDDDALSISSSGSSTGRQEPETQEDPYTAIDAEQELGSGQEQGQELELALAAPPQARLIDRMLDWLFGDIAPGVQAAEDAVNDEHVVQDLADEAPFVPFIANEPREPANPIIQDPDVAAAAAQAGIDLNDQDAIDDAEDLEGIMELIGMQGPLTGLFQNAMFSAVLISATLALAVWVPYLWGKVVLLFMGSPISLLVKLPLRLIAILTDFVVDLILIAGVGLLFCVAALLHILLSFCPGNTVIDYSDEAVNFFTQSTFSIIQNAIFRISKSVRESPTLPPADYFRLSINSHTALRTIQNSSSYAFNRTGDAVVALYGSVAVECTVESSLKILSKAPALLQDLFASAFTKSTELMSSMWNAKSYQITLDFDMGSNATAAYTATEQWTANDRLIAVSAGYTFFALLGAVYLRRGTPFSTSQQGRKIETIVTEVLQQAGGVLKVILIISIEMLVFPLYCGLLLDLALLPLFHNANLYTRWEFTRESPWTSGFVHWFIGTCYMFHFALFVSMCRKIMRKGVLYFIRDPDDPTFHPVRDVLERSVTTQLRKIAFSALVYGALVVVCLGGVVWSLSHATTGVLPVHWASQAPALEFPLDLLFYNFLTPVIIKLYKPSDGLHAVSQWWFRRCARLLRLSNFLFGDKLKDEEGYHIRRTWLGWFTGENGDPENPVIGEDGRAAAEEEPTRAYFLFDGKYVRAPASDQARIPKGEVVFVEVDQHNTRKDGKADEGGVHNSDFVTMVYIPPWFRVRIALFVSTIWVFAAVMGIGLTVIPLLFGRYLFSLFLPPTVEMNDIHAFSLGIYSLGTIGYSVYKLYKFVSGLNRAVPSPLSTLYTIAATGSRIGFRIIRFGYVWTSLAFVIPFLIAVLIELYLLMPLHAYLGPSEPHVVHLIQDWTLGFLYARLAARIVFSNRASRPARAFSAIIADGYLNPNARITTRCFLLPVAAIFAIAIAFPSAFAFALNSTVCLGASPAVKNQVWRFSFPVLGLSVVAVWIGKEGLSMLNRWRLIVRDEVYLIGERLHNFGERKAPPAPAPAPANNTSTTTARA
ncbi:hypothetical protein BDV95DRAFT_582124 [Massariosphaeria phaeospora]|uniref:RING-type E3 ubiquitin transferase n=1 Tax=Massariosphaeria phaeospora TaxID=100035 RepID=A0A7C8M4F1_9PLEO|nr:hypothetical protein BDV95DRAFT_582124 [Massariosphaeria phaeospora]